MNSIVWLASYPRSGNTWLRLVLANLLSFSEEPIDFPQLDSEGLASRDLFDRSVGWETSESTPEEIAGWRLPVQTIIGSSAGPVFLKTHDVFRHPVSQAPLFSGTATRCAIYIVRNPLDVAVSYKARFAIDGQEMIRILNDPEAALTATGDDIPLPELLSDWSTHVTSWVEQSSLRVLPIRYEDMIARPEETFAAAFQFAGLTVDAVRLRRALEHSAFDVLQRKERERRPSQTLSPRRFFREGRVGAGARNLNADEVAAIAQRHATVMRRFGYASDIPLA